jgi:hypothetical protein
VHKRIKCRRDAPEDSIQREEKEKLKENEKKKDRKFNWLRFALSGKIEGKGCVYAYERMCLYKWRGRERERERLTPGLKRYSKMENRRAKRRSGNISERRVDIDGDFSLT